MPQLGGTSDLDMSDYKCQADLMSDCKHEADLMYYCSLSLDASIWGVHLTWVCLTVNVKLSLCLTVNVKLTLCHTAS